MTEPGYYLYKDDDAPEVQPAAPFPDNVCEECNRISEKMIFHPSKSQWFCYDCFKDQALPAIAITCPSCKNYPCYYPEDWKINPLTEEWLGTFYHCYNCHHDFFIDAEAYEEKWDERKLQLIPKTKEVQSHA